jgi:hypothetical protein
MNLDTTQLLAIAAALGWASGLRLYAVVFLTGLAGFLGYVELPQGLQVLQSPLVLWASGADHAEWALIAALAGGTLAATAHAAKASTRAAVNTSPEPFSNIGVSFFEDGLVPLSLWLALSHPIVFFVLLAFALLAMVGLIVLTAKFLKALAQTLRTRFA